jgi:hypothetical protein
VTATTPFTSIRNSVMLDPLLYGVGFAPSSVTGGATIEASVFLNASAPLGGVTVQLTSDRPDVAPVPASVFVPAGLSEVDFAIATSPVAAAVNVNITASYAGASPVATLTVTP